MDAVQAFWMALLAEGIGVAIGVLLLYVFNIQSKRLIGMLFGCTSGIMIAMICFDILPEALQMANPMILLLGVGAGVLVGLLMEDWSHELVGKLPIKQTGSMGTAVVLLVGIALHNIPEGFALGTLAMTAPESVMQFAVVICLHSIPEAIAIAIPMKFSQVKKRWLVCIPFLLGSVMGIGAFCGYLLSKIAVGLIAFALGSAAGIILYIVCDELIPESRKIWNGRMTSIATVLGVILGMLLVS